MGRLVEQFNKTLRSMLRQILAREKGYWDVMLQYVSFACREVPQDTVGFSPFKLIFR